MGIAYMKLQIAFDFTDLDKALAIATEVEKYADIIEVGSLLIYKHGEHAVKTFKEKFPQKLILADAKITDKTRESVTLFAHAGADWITVLAGAGKHVIHTACTTAHQLGKKIMLDLGDTSSLGQTALEAKSFGVDALLLHKPLEEEENMLFSDKWDMVKGNTTVPVFISAAITPDNIIDIKSISPAGIVIGKAITHAEKPKTTAEYFWETLRS
jgi:3-hexulose-6-phosphate synthase